MEVLKRHIVRIPLEENKNLDWKKNKKLIKCIFNEKKIRDSNIILSEIDLSGHPVSNNLFILFVIPLCIDLEK